MIEVVELEQLQNIILRLLDQGALELCLNEAEKVLFVPFVMNDGVESYFRFEECSVQGKIDQVDEEGDEAEEVSVQLTKTEQKQGYIIRQASGNIVSIWFRDVRKVTKCYQYHLIGHGWRRAKGEEAIRRLVNILCVIHDKRNYLGEEYCNELEIYLANLAEFPPILDFSPIDQSILDWYPQSLKGIEAARWLIQKAGNLEHLLDEVDAYQISYKKGKNMTKRIQKIAALLKRKENQVLWNVLEKVIEEASMGWEPRNYEPETLKKMKEHQEQVIEKYKKLGFEGEFPTLTSTGGGEVAQIKLVEQQPFTVMEEESFYHRIFSMALDQDRNVLKWKEESSNLL